MSIEKVEMFTVVCDNCGKDSGEDSDYSCWGDKQAAREQADYNMWLTNHEGKDYCEECYKLDDDDNYVIIPKSKQA